MEKKQIGVLAVQGAFAEHIAMVRRLGAEAFEIRQLPDLERSIRLKCLSGLCRTVKNCRAAVGNLHSA